MTCYIISYDLRAPGRNYEQLYAAIRSYEKWAHINDSLWAIVTSSSAVGIRDNLTRFVDANDRLFVIKSGTEAAWRNSICKHEWLKGNL